METFTKKVTNNTREAFAQLLDWCSLLLFSDFLVLLFVCSRFEPLPGKASAQKIHEDMSKSFQVVSSRLFCDKKLLFCMFRPISEHAYLYLSVC